MHLLLLHIYFLFSYPVRLLPLLVGRPGTTYYPTYYPQKPANRGHSNNLNKTVQYIFSVRMSRIINIKLIKKIRTKIFKNIYKLCKNISVFK